MALCSLTYGGTGLNLLGHHPIIGAPSYWGTGTTGNT